MIRLVCFDMDGVIFEKKNFWMELHKALGTYEKGKELTEKHLKKDYARLVEEVVAKLWKGKKADKYFELVRKTRYTKGAKATVKELKKMGIKTAIISSGPKDLAVRAKKELGIDFVFYNGLVIRDNKITGKFNWPIGHGTKEKIRIVKSLSQKLGISLQEVAFVGDNDNDVGVCKKVGLSIAFNSESKVLKKICDISIEGKDLTLVLRQNFYKRSPTLLKR
ncbi:MAG: HAD family phosphatase [Candidatus Woesearchaeota archaeon]